MRVEPNYEINIGKKEATERCHHELAGATAFLNTPAAELIA
jgi:hypothetical protein